MNIDHSLLYMNNNFVVESVVDWRHLIIYNGYNNHGNPSIETVGRTILEGHPVQT